MVGHEYVICLLYTFDAADEEVKVKNCEIMNKLIYDQNNVL